MTTHMLSSTLILANPHGVDRVFTGEEDHVITLQEAANLTRSYRAGSAANAVKAGYLGRDAIEAMLNQDLAVGIRIYFARRTDGLITFVLAAVKADRDDIFEGILSEDAWLCPPWCSSPNELNSDRTTTYTSNARRVRFTGHENHFVTLAEAARLTRAFREQAGPGVPKGGYFSRRIFELIFRQQGCVGLRVYLGMTDPGKLTFVLSGVDSTGEDMTQGVLGEDAWLCPPWCGKANPLNR